MRVTIYLDNNMEEDGYDGSLRLVREHVETLEDLMYVWQQGTVSAGFTYSEAVGCHKDDGTVTWSGF